MTDLVPDYKPQLTIALDDTVVGLPAEPVPTLKLGEISLRLGFTVTADFLA
ncbi:MAG: hypothetical protein JO253_04695 [Alphaproteobacteria bacterium]|nr:hypothetical protein [Alphaproteobacteria bacterium]